MRNWPVSRILVAVLSVVVIVLVCSVWVWSAGKIDHLTREGLDREASISDLTAALDQANATLADLGEEPVSASPGPSVGPSGHDGVDGADGRDGADGVDGRDGVDGQDGAPGAPGRDGRDGAPGQPGQSATDEQVAAAVEAYCAANGGCLGPKGDAGAAGAIGPGPTDAQVYAAIALFCAQNTCVAPAQTNNGG